jgi:hypothetical protein
MKSMQIDENFRKRICSLKGLHLKCAACNKNILGSDDGRSSYDLYPLSLGVMAVGVGAPGCH